MLLILGLEKVMMTLVLVVFLQFDDFFQGFLVEDETVLLLKGGFYLKCGVSRKADKVAVYERADG